MSEFNYYSKLIKLKNQFGKDLFLICQIGLCCEACRKANLACTHLLDRNPHWKPPELVAKVDAIMETNPVLRDRETRGEVASTKRYLLSEAVVDAFEKRSTVFFPNGTPRVLYSGIDPSGGGSGSGYAIVTGCPVMEDYGVVVRATT